MRAKMQVSKVERFPGQDRITCNAVCRSAGYPADGSDEDNTYAKFSPSGELTLTIANPALVHARQAIPTCTSCFKRRQYRSWKKSRSNLATNLGAKSCSAPGIQ